MAYVHTVTEADNGGAYIILSLGDVRHLAVRTLETIAVVRAQLWIE